MDVLHLNRSVRRYAARYGSADTTIQEPVAKSTVVHSGHCVTIASVVIRPKTISFFVEPPPSAYALYNKIIDGTSLSKRSERGTTTSLLPLPPTAYGVQCYLRTRGIPYDADTVAGRAGSSPVLRGGGDHDDENSRRTPTRRNGCEGRFLISIATVLAPHTRSRPTEVLKLRRTPGGHDTTWRRRWRRSFGRRSRYDGCTMAVVSR